MTYDEKIAQVVEMAFKADLDEDAKVIVNEAIRVATEVNAELDDIWEDYNTMKTKYDYVIGLVAHLEELAKKYKEEVDEYRTKLENGTLIELPCKVGEMLYEVIEGMPIQEWKVESISFNRAHPKGALWAERTHDRAHWILWAEDCGTKWFTTKAEAEAMLLQLKGEKQ